MTKINLPITQIQGLTLGKGNTTGNPAVDAVVQQFIQSGFSPQQALALTQSGSITQMKASQSDWLNTVKNFPITEDVSGVSVAEAQKNPFYAQLISQGAATMGSPEAAWAAIQSGSAAAGRALEVQAMTAKANIEAALAPERVAMMGINQAINESGSMAKLFNSTTSGKALQAIQTYLPNIESAYQSGGKGVSALTMIDALVKIDTGGQAIRQGQTNLLAESGTWGDSAVKFMNKLGLNTSATGANTQLSPAQVQQIYDLAKQTAAEKIQAVQPAYQAYRTGMQTLATAHPEAQAEIEANSGVAGYDDFFNKYGADLTASGGGTPDTATSILLKYGIK
jgi:hypothetical protein